MTSQASARTAAPSSTPMQALVAALEKSQAGSVHTWKAMFSILALALLAFYVHSAIHHLHSPWGLRHHAELRGNVSSQGVVLAEALAVLSLSLALASVWARDRHHSSGLAIAAGALGVCLVLFWLPPVLSLRGSYRWILLWRPFAPWVIAALSRYIWASAADMDSEIQKLRALMYNCKKV